MANRGRPCTGGCGQKVGRESLGHPFSEEYAIRREWWAGNRIAREVLPGHLLSRKFWNFRPRMIPNNECNQFQKKKKKKSNTKH